MRKEKRSLKDTDWSLNQERTPLMDAVLSYSKKRPAYFCIPGHRFERGINEKWKEHVGDGIFQFDLTETAYTDDLHNATGAIKDAEELAAEIFGAQYTHFLVNGTTCGNEAMVLTASFHSKKIAIPRNAHKSVLMGLILSGMQPVYLMPEVFQDTGLHGGIRPEEVERVLQDHADCKSVLIVSPTYYGLCSDVKGIAEVCHRHGAMLMVDEAHGAHCYFSDQLPEGALTQGADMCAQSIHKVTGSLTQSSMLHVHSNLVNRGHLENNLHLVQSTSPSYILMTSLDAARHDLAIKGTEMIAYAVELAERARSRIRAISGFSCVGNEVIGRCSVTGFDCTRLTFSGAQIGLTGFELKKMLFDEYGCDAELADYRNVLAIVTFANEEQELDKLVHALKDISGKYGQKTLLSPGKQLPAIPEYVLSPRDAYFAEKESVSWENALGCVAAEMIAPYPPGIPVVCPGERIDKEVWQFLNQYKREHGHFHGPADSKLDSCRIIKESNGSL